MLMKGRYGYAYVIPVFRALEYVKYVLRELNISAESVDVDPPWIRININSFSDVESLRGFFLNSKVIKLNGFTVSPGYWYIKLGL